MLNFSSGWIGRRHTDPASPNFIFRQKILEEYLFPLTGFGMAKRATWFPVPKSVHHHAAVAIAKFPSRDVESLIGVAQDSLETIVKQLSDCGGFNAPGAFVLLTTLMESELRGMRGTVHRGVFLSQTARLGKGEAEVETGALREKAKELANWVAQERTNVPSGVKSGWAIANVLVLSTMTKNTSEGHILQERSSVDTNGAIDRIINQSSELRRLNDLIRTIALPDHPLLRISGWSIWSQYFQRSLPQVATILAAAGMSNVNADTARYFANLLLKRLYESEDFRSSITVGLNLVSAISGLAEALRVLATEEGENWLPTSDVITSLFDNLADVESHGIPDDWPSELQDAGTVALGYVAAQLDVTDERRVANGLTIIESFSDQTKNSDATSYASLGLSKLVQRLSPSSVYFGKSFNVLLDLFRASKPRGDHTVVTLALAACIPSVAASRDEGLCLQLLEVAQAALEELKSYGEKDEQPHISTVHVWLVVKAVEVGWLERASAAETVNKLVDRVQKRQRASDPNGLVMIAHSYFLSLGSEESGDPGSEDLMSSLISTSNSPSNSALVRSQALIALLSGTGLDPFSMTFSAAPNVVQTLTALPHLRRLSESPDVRVARTAVICLGRLVWAVLLQEDGDDRSESTGRFLTAGGRKEPRDLSRLDAGTSWLRSCWEALESAGTKSPPSMENAVFLLSAFRDISLSLPSVDWRPLLSALIRNIRESGVDPNMDFELLALEFASNHARITGSKSLLDHILILLGEFFAAEDPPKVLTDAVWRIRRPLVGELGLGTIMTIGGLIPPGEKTPKAAMAGSKVVEVVGTIVGWALGDVYALSGDHFEVRQRQRLSTLSAANGFFFLSVVVRPPASHMVYFGNQAHLLDTET
ncbi:hypothetical protein M427DRAFT_454353 [Gonapodya prolifera JEL478]|uniref:DUF3730 domain-containing protein n=1 Tax=Gonapodya prolifera (strain JEL478) TaxID=1344416 RepID=A0A139AS86_GONPJ|nr:hypothetical protein M427DRAFT_454353 [Gonapodya prolifera JEL478]|eukprot:KXS19608.1 hypothetical protein M427DRAFT_454353 [Gonapodya prolifera JEL478]